MNITGWSSLHDTTSIVAHSNMFSFIELIVVALVDNDSHLAQLKRQRLRWSTLMDRFQWVSWKPCRSYHGFTSNNEFVQTFWPNRATNTTSCNGCMEAYKICYPLSRYNLLKKKKNRTEQTEHESVGSYGEGEPCSRARARPRQHRRRAGAARAWRRGQDGRLRAQGPVMVTTTTSS